MIHSATLAYFSPTQTTRRVLRAIASGLRIPTEVELDLTLPSAETRDRPALKEGLLILGAPVYGGRVAPMALSRFGCLKGEDTPAVVVAVYGNREYEDALLELGDFAASVGLRPVAGAAFVGEHSYATEQAPIAWGRPDAADLARAAEFGRLIQERLEASGDLTSPPASQLPGRRPYVVKPPQPASTPTTDEALCNLCGECLEVCPAAAVTLADVARSDSRTCIRCSACIKHCPTGARSWKAEKVLETMARLAATCIGRREPELYF